MGLSAGTLTLFREKSLFFDGAHPGPDLEEYARLNIRSNRILWLLTHDNTKINLVVRGHNVPSTLRLSGRVFDAFKSDPTIFKKDSSMDWENLFSESSSDYETNFDPDLWFGVYVDGKKIATSTNINPAIDMLEDKAKGKEIDENFLKSIATDITDRRSVRLRHDSVAAIILSNLSSGIRCAIIDRRQGKDAGFSFKIQNPAKKKIKISSALNMAADIFEMQNLYSIIERLEKVLNGELPKSAMPVGLEHIEAIQIRNQQLNELVRSGHDVFDISYRPSPPGYLPKISS